MKRVVSIAAGISMLLCSTTAFAQIQTGQVAFVTNGEDQSVSARTLVYDITDNQEATLFLASYDTEGKLTGIQSASGTNAVLSTGSLASGAGSYKAYIWDKESLQPLQNTATKGSSNADLSMIYLNGEPLDGFMAGTSEYSVKLDTSNAVMPRVTATAADNGSAVAIKEEVASGGATATATITVTPQTGDVKTYTVNFSIDAAEVNTHVVRGATSDDDFAAEANFASDQTFNKTAATNAWVVNSFYSDANFSRDGAALRTNRDPLTESGNKMRSFINYNEELEGLDYLVFEHNVPVSTTFTLDAPAEVIVASDSVATSELDGFAAATEYELFSGVYENPMTSTTIYSLIKDNGFTADDFVKTGNDQYRFKALDSEVAKLGEKYQTKTALPESDIYNKEVSEIAAFVEGSGEVEVTDSGTPLLATIGFRNFSKRSYEAGAEVNLSFKASKTLVFLKPISESEIKPVVSAYQFVGPTTWAAAKELLPPEMINNELPSGDSSISPNLLSNCQGALGKFAYAAQAYTEETYTPGKTNWRYIGNSDSILGLEGKDFLITSRYWVGADPGKWYAGLYSGNSISGIPCYVENADLPAVDWVSFKLNRPATVMVFPMNNQSGTNIPDFLTNDDGWTEVELDQAAFTRDWGDPYGEPMVANNPDIYAKYMFVKQYDAGTVTLPTAGTPNEYYVIID